MPQAAKISIHCHWINPWSNLRSSMFPHFELDSVEVKNLLRSALRNVKETVFLFKSQSRGTIKGGGEGTKRIGGFKVGKLIREARVSAGAALFAAAVF